MNLSYRVETFGPGDPSWLGSEHGRESTRSITLDLSAFTANTHYPNGYFRGGTPLAKITATGLYGPYNNASSDGTEVLAGFLAEDVAVEPGTTDDIPAALLWHGAVREAKLPIAVDSAGKADVAGRIYFV